MRAKIAHVAAQAAALLVYAFIGMLLFYLVGWLLFRNQPTAAERQAFLKATTSVPWSDADRLEAGQGMCDYLHDFRNDSGEDIREDGVGWPLSDAFDLLHRNAVKTGATIDQAFDLHRAAVTHLCGYQPYVTAWQQWRDALDVDVVSNRPQE